MIISAVVGDFYVLLSTSNFTKKKRDNKPLLNLNRDHLIEKDDSKSRPHKFPIPRIKNAKKIRLSNLNRNNRRIDNKVTDSPNFQTQREGEQEGIRSFLECVLEYYHCCFCKYNGSHQDMEIHYYDCHEEDLEKIPGIYLSRKIELLIINGDKYFVKSILKL